METERYLPTLPNRVRGYLFDYDEPSFTTRIKIVNSKVPQWAFTGLNVRQIEGH